MFNKHQNEKDNKEVSSYAEIVKRSQASSSNQQQSLDAIQKRQARNLQSLDHYYIMNRFSSEFLRTIENNDFKIQNFHDKGVPSLVQAIMNFNNETETYQFSCYFHPCLFLNKTYNSIIFFLILKI